MRSAWRRARKEVRANVAAARDRDPAAREVSSFGILAGWAGVQALLAHRVAHAMLEAGAPMAARTIAYLSRAVTGVEIHPAARIGEGFFIDHGSGVVIGETAEIGDRVTLYQGVTLGGTGLEPGKRHPTVGDDVTIGAGAKLLGPDLGWRLCKGWRQHGCSRGRAGRGDRGRQPRPPRQAQWQAGRGGGHGGGLSRLDPAAARSILEGDVAERGGDPTEPRKPSGRRPDRARSRPA